MIITIELSDEEKQWIIEWMEKQSREDWSYIDEQDRFNMKAQRWLKEELMLTVAQVRQEHLRLTDILAELAAKAALAGK